MLSCSTCIYRKRNGLEVLRELKRSELLPPTLILTTFDEDKFVIGGLQAGAKGYLLKDVSLEQLTSAIRTLAGGGTLVYPAVTQQLLDNLDRIQCDFPSTEVPEPLSGREGDSSAGGARLQQPRDRGRAHHCGRNGEELHIQHPLENGCEGSNAGSAEGA